MTRKPFRWTRALYRRAARETRVYESYGFMYHGEPGIVRRYRELWEQHPQAQDPLRDPLRYRLQRRYDDEVPF